MLLQPVQHGGLERLNADIEPVVRFPCREWQRSRADIELLVEDAVATFDAAVDCTWLPGSAKWPRHALPVQILGDCPGRFTGEIVAKDAPDDDHFCFIDLSRAACIGDQFLNAGANQRDVRNRAVDVDIRDGPTLSLSIQATEPQLVLDRRVTLAIIAVAGIKGNTRHCSLLLRTSTILRSYIVKYECVSCAGLGSKTILRTRPQVAKPLADFLGSA